MIFLQRVQATAMLAVMSMSGAVLAQGAADSFPSRPVAIIVPLAAGGPNDSEARLYAAKLNALLGQQFSVESRAGASGTIGANYVAKSAPDGHTLLLTGGSFTTSAALYKDLPYDAIKDFAPVSLMSLKHFVLVVPASSPIRNVSEYLAYARANPGKLNYATTGVGSTPHLAGAWLHNLTNTKVTFVAYKGAAPQMADLMAGRVDVAPLNLQGAAPLIKNGKLRGLGAMGDTRSSVLPGLATIAEQGVPGYSNVSYIGFSAAGATPVAIVNKLHEALVKVIRMPDIIAALEAQGSVPVGSTPTEFRQMITSETLRWRKVVQESAIVLVD